MPNVQQNLSSRELGFRANWSSVSNAPADRLDEKFGEVRIDDVHL